MRSLPSLGLLAFASLAVLASPVAAQVVVRTPFVDVRVGNGVYVRAPFVTLYVPARRTVRMAPPPRPVRVVRASAQPPLVVPAPTPIGPPTRRQAEPPPVPVEELRTLPVSPVPVVRPLTVQEFAASFRPVAGTYEVMLEHPRTHRPVKVCFTLPEGAPRKVRVNRLKLEFDYGRRKVTVRFFHNGTVRVRS